MTGTRPTEYTSDVIPSLRLLPISLMFWQVACSTNRVIRDRDYETSVNAYRRGDTAAALEKFPNGERGGLITSIEKSWLAVWEQKWDPTPLQKQVETFDQRNYASVTREAGYFLLQEAEEGYVPAEHEVIVLHLLSAIHFLQVSKAEDAKVELRQAGYLLDHFWDNAALRLWLGSLWAATGQWEEAVVDFRRAQTLSPSLALRELIQSKPPKGLTLEFYGVAPVLHWTDGEYTPKFSLEPGEPQGQMIRANTLAWFKRHEKRNTALRDILVKSNFMAQYLGSKAITQTERGMNKTAAWSIRAAAVAIGAAITAAVIYALTKTNSSGAFTGEGADYLLGAGLAVGTGIWVEGEKLDEKLERNLREEEQNKQDDLKIYRLVRFMPGWISVAPQVTSTMSLGSVVKLKSLSGATRVTLINHF